MRLFQISPRWIRASMETSLWCSVSAPPLLLTVAGAREAHQLGHRDLRKAHRENIWQAWRACPVLLATLWSHLSFLVTAEPPVRCLYQSGENPLTESIMRGLWIKYEFHKGMHRQIIQCNNPIYTLMPRGVLCWGFFASRTLTSCWFQHINQNPKAVQKYLKNNPEKLHYKCCFTKY